MVCYGACPSRRPRNPPYEFPRPTAHRSASPPLKISRARRYNSPQMATGTSASMANAQENGRGVVLVTGASGFVGSAVAAAFRGAGYRVRVLVRASSPKINIDARDDVFVGDILNRASVAAAVGGARYLVHVAADYRLWAPSPDDIVRTNVEGTRIVMEDAAHAGLERTVHTTTVGSACV